MPVLGPPIPVLRIFDGVTARLFYEDYLGFALDWEHRFAPDLPLYMQIRRDSLILHLSEHLGDGTPGTVVYVWIEGIDAIRDELAARPHPVLQPEIETAQWGARVLEVIDPSGNRLRFAERIARPK